MIEFLTGPIMLCEQRYFIQMNNIICVVKGQRTKCDVCLHPAITFNRADGGEGEGELSVRNEIAVHAGSCKCAVTVQHYCRSPTMCDIF